MEYPECEKMRKVKDQSQVIGEFLDWLHGEKNILFAEQRGEPPFDRILPVLFNTEELLAEFFNIDLKKVEQEKRAMLDEIRKKNGVDK